MPNDCGLRVVGLESRGGARLATLGRILRLRSGQACEGARPFTSPSRRAYVRGRLLNVVELRYGESDVGLWHEAAAV
jgi:hypothetical protein